MVLILFTLALLCSAGNAFKSLFPSSLMFNRYLRSCSIFSPRLSSTDASTATEAITVTVTDSVAPIAVDTISIEPIAIDPALVTPVTIDSVSAAPIPAAPVSAAGPLIFYPSNTSFCLCSNCKTAFLISEKELGVKGSRVRCTVCSKDWFQATEKLARTDDSMFITDMTDDKLAEVKRILNEKNTPRYPRTDRAEVFVGNLPYLFTEKEIADLFAEYGLSNISLVKDPAGKSKGFAFIEVSISANMIPRTACC